MVRTVTTDKIQTALPRSTHKSLNLYHLGCFQAAAPQTALEPLIHAEAAAPWPITNDFACGSEEGFGSTISRFPSGGVLEPLVQDGDAHSIKALAECNVGATALPLGHVTREGLPVSLPLASRDMSSFSHPHNLSQKAHASVKMESAEDRFIVREARSFVAASAATLEVRPSILYEHIPVLS